MRPSRTIAWSVACGLSAFALGCEPQPPARTHVEVAAPVAPEPSDAPAVPDPADVDEADGLLADAAGDASCYASDERDDAFLCVVDPFYRGREYVPRQLLAGDRRALFAFERRKKLCCQAPDPPSSTFVTFHDAPGHVRLPDGWAAAERARQRGLVDPADRSTGEFFVAGLDRRLDSGQAPALMRSRDGASAALRCAETLHRFTALSTDQQRDLLASAEVDWTRGPRLDLGAAPSGDELAGGRRTGPCSQLFGPPSDEHERFAAQEKERERALAPPTLTDVTWCIDREGESPWLDVREEEIVRERMGSRVARDVTALAERLHALEPEGDWHLTFEPARLRGVHAWWRSLEYGAPRPAARLEVVTRFGTNVPKTVRLESHTAAGERFTVEFEHCTEPRIYEQIGAKRLDGGPTLLERLQGGAGKTTMSQANDEVAK